MKYDGEKSLELEYSNQKTVSLNVPELNKCVNHFDMFSDLPDFMKFDSVSRKFTFDVCKITESQKIKTLVSLQ